MASLIDAADFAMTAFEQADPNERTDPHDGQDQGLTGDDQAPDAINPRGGADPAAGSREGSMKAIITAAIGLALSGVACSASAYSLSPANTKFRLNGHVRIITAGQDGNGKCQSKWIGVTNSPGADKIRQFSFSGSKHACMIAYTQLLPAKISIVSASTVSVSVAWLYPKGGECGGNPLSFTINASGIWSVHWPVGDCTIIGALKSTPPVTIVP